MTLSERVLQLLARDRRSSLCDVSDYMDDFQRQKEMTAQSLPSKRSFFLTEAEEELTIADSAFSIRSIVAFLRVLSSLDGAI